MSRHRLALLPTDLAEPAPVINTTPLIDLMLVLLVMFIISIPIATHNVPLDLPQGPPVPRQPVPVHRIDLDQAGRLYWNGQPLQDTALPAHLARVAADPALPELHIAVDGEARYERVDQVLAAISRSGIHRMGFVGNERFAHALDQRPH